MDYAADEHWALVHEPGLLVLHAGADELFAFEDVGDGAAAELLALWHAEVIRPEGLSREAADIFEQLKAAAIVCPRLETRASYTLAIRFAGSSDAVLEAAIADALPAAIAIGDDDSAEADLVLIVRTNGALADVVDERYGRLTAPHLLLDLAFDHTICLGPLVFVQQTACLGCLVERLSHYWGDVTPPRVPHMTEHRALSAGLVALSIQNILMRADRTLVNRTVAYDVRAHDVQSHAVFRLPVCPVCGSAATARPSPIALPWAPAR